jgi:MYXO-CTERM domain-containing protein
MQGTPLAWHSSRVPYAVATAASKQISLADATRVADLAFAAWSATCPDGQAVGVQAYDDGPVDVPDGDEGDALVGWASCSESNQCNAVAHDVIVFDDESWPYSDPVNTLALTTVTYGQDDGEIFEVYTEVNSAEHQLTAQPPSPGGATFDLQAILTHEAGHFLGLAHATDTSAIMYAFYEPGHTVLTDDDKQGICTVYPPSSSKGCSCQEEGSGPGAAAAAAALSLAVLAGLRRRRSRVPRFSSTC